ncbi:hypothetical protein BJ875DRAFT_389311, partial [Amylocarpus encephaloides]
WLGILNLIFAITAYYRHLSNSDYRGHHTDHLVFCARAKLLCMDESLLYRDARISTVYAMGLQCLYCNAALQGARVKDLNSIPCSTRAEGTLYIQLCSSNYRIYLPKNSSSACPTGIPISP